METFLGTNGSTIGEHTYFVVVLGYLLRLNCYKLHIHVDFKFQNITLLSVCFLSAIRIRTESRTSQV